MDIADVPQDRNITLDGQRKVVYAKDAQGKLCITTCSGWEVEEIVTTQALEHLQNLSQLAKEQVKLGLVSPLSYWMHTLRMDEALLAQSSGFWRWQVRRHLMPEHFEKLSLIKLARYAQALGLSVANLKTIPE
jgi:hypothetical protein